MQKVYTQLVFLTLLLYSTISFSQTSEFWGTTAGYGVYGGGAIFKMDKQGNNFEVVFSPNTISIGQVYRGEWLVYNDSLAYAFSNHAFFELNYKKYEIKGKEGPSNSNGIIKTQSGRYFGLNQTGGNANSGYLFEFLPALDSFRILHHFSQLNNGLFTPSGVLVEANNGKLYGVANQGGDGGGGVFSYDPVNNLYEEVMNNLYIPINSDYSGGFTKAQNGKLYLAIGFLMELDPSTNQIRNVINNFPVLSNRFIEASNGNLYAAGGNRVYEFNPVSESVRSVPMHFSSNYCSMFTEVSDSIFYGVASSGKLFKFDLLSDSVEVMKTFSVQEYDNGFNPQMQLLKLNDSLLIGFNADGGNGQKGNQFVYNILTDSVKVVNHIDYANKGRQVISMTLASDNNIYGSMSIGGKYNGGVVFRIDPLNNNFEKLYDVPRKGAGKLLEYDSLKFISTARLGGSRNQGGIYKFDAISKTYTLSVELDSIDLFGFDLSNNLAHVSNGWYVGATLYGGVYGKGTIFLYNPFLDSLVIKKHFNANYGSTSSSFKKISDSIFVSTSLVGGVNSSGVLFKYNLSSNTVKILHYFNNLNTQNTSYPIGDVIVKDSIIYGTTSGSQDVSESVVYSFNLHNNQFSVLTRGQSSILSDGIVRNEYGELYGMMRKGGTDRLGSVFKIDTFNQYNELRELNYKEGSNPYFGFYDFEYCQKPSNVIIDLDTIYACKNEKVKLFVDSSSVLRDADYWYLYKDSNFIQKIDSSKDRTIEFTVDSTYKYYVRAEGSCVKPSNVDSVFVSVRQDRAYYMNDTIDVCYTDSLIFDDSLLINSALSDTLIFLNHHSVASCDSIISIFVNVTPENEVVDSSNFLVCLERNAESYKWYDCRNNTPIPGANGRVFSPSDSGLYKVEITLNGCVRESDCIPYFSVGLNENHFQNSINFYPNPSNGLINIDLSQKQQSLQVKVRNIHGQLVQEEQFVNQSNLQLQLKGKPGIYFIELENEQGERANLKVVKR